MSTLALPVPSAGGSLDTYIQSVSRFPFLTQEQEKATKEKEKQAAASPSGSEEKTAG